MTEPATTPPDTPVTREAVEREFRVLRRTLEGQHVKAMEQVAFAEIIVSTYDDGSPDAEELGRLTVVARARWLVIEHLLDGIELHLDDIADSAIELATPAPAPEPEAPADTTDAAQAQPRQLEDRSSSRRFGFWRLR